MFKFFKNLSEKRKLTEKIELMKAKAELMKAKAAISAQKAQKGLREMGQAAKHIETAEDLKQLVAESMPAATPAAQILQILENSTVQSLLIRAAAKFFGEGKVEKDDDELINMYQTLPSDIKKKVKTFAMAYVGKK